MSRIAAPEKWHAMVRLMPIAEQEYRNVIVESDQKGVT